MTTPTPDDQSQDQRLGKRDVYNIVTDVGIGPNVRLRDNLIQAAAVVIALILGAGIGALIIEDRLAGSLVGGFFGLLTGLLISGIYLMVYRLIRHARGKHD
jgi:hypothetical protein